MYCSHCEKEIESDERWSVELIVYDDNLEPWQNELHQDLLCHECAKKAVISFKE